MEPKKKRSRPSRKSRDRTRKSRSVPDRKAASQTRPREPAREQRLNKVLSLSGVTSRRKADEMIQAGRVTLNGRVVTAPGTRVLWGEDIVRVDGDEIPPPSERLYIMLNKPFGYISSLHDPEGRPVVGGLLKGVDKRVYPVGRLDFDSIGLLLMTNDGEWAHRLTHPRYRVPRTYKATVAGRITEGEIERLRTGVPLEDGFSGQAGVSPVSIAGERSVIRITVTIGRNRMVRRMLEAVGHGIIQLVRIGFGPLVLGELKVGRYRHLEPHEVEAVRKMVGLP